MQYYRKKIEKIFCTSLTDFYYGDIIGVKTIEEQMMMEKKKISSTLIDVARKAGVSTATASRVLSNADYPVSKELRKKVIKASAELNYVPNVFGKLLKGSASNVIGIIMPSLQNPFYNQIIFGIESAAAKYGCEIRLFSSHRNMEQERLSILTLLRSRVMALIIISIDNSPEALNNYIACGGKVALLEAEFELENAITAETDWFGAGRIAAGHLAALGHKNIAFLTSPLTKTFRREILAGVKAELAGKDRRFSDEDVFEATAEEESYTGIYEFEIGYQLTGDVLRSRKKYTAIISINDITAFGVIQALTQNSISVPGDVSVIGFDNILYSKMISPPLTTVELPSGNMGRTACQMLIAAMDAGTEDLSPASFSFPCRLKMRKSTAEWISAAEQ